MVDGWRDEGALDAFIAQAHDEYHSTLDPDLDPMDEWLLMQDLVKVTVGELEGNHNLQLEQSILHEMWNIIYPDVHWVHVTYDTNAFGWGKHHIMPFMLYDDWLVNQDRINLETGRVEDGDLMTVIGSYDRVKQERSTRAASNKKIRKKFDDFR